jgi:predicted Zn-dependent protease
MKKLFSKYYSKAQCIGLLEIMHEKIIPKGTVIKMKDQPFDDVFIINFGTMGLYVFPYGEKTLMSSFTTQEVVGEWNMNFLSSKAAQYEADTDMHIIYFSREEYEKVVFLVKQDIYESNGKYFERFPTFKALAPNLMKMLCLNTKQRAFNKNEHVALNGCQAD